MFTIKLYKVRDENNKVNKFKTQVAEGTGALREGCSVYRPAVTMEVSASILKDANYMYIEEFGRYYFIEDIKTEANGLFTFSARCDVLQSFFDQIQNCTAYIERSSNKYNMYLADNVPQKVNRAVVVKNFDTIFSTQDETYTLITGGALFNG